LLTGEAGPAKARQVECRPSSPLEKVPVMASVIPFIKSLSTYLAEMQLRNIYNKKIKDHEKVLKITGVPVAFNVPLGQGSGIATFFRSFGVRLEWI